MNTSQRLSKHRQQISKILEKLEANDWFLKEAYRDHQELAKKNKSLKEQLNSTKAELSTTKRGKSDAELEVSRLQSELELESKKATAELQKVESEIPGCIRQAIKEFKVSAELDQYVLDSPSKRLLRTKSAGMLFLRVAPELDLDGYDLKLGDIPPLSSSKEDSENDLEEDGSEAEP
ncbi:hypothetical protein NE237_006910 [Protea cynaroides]|uniref:Uncharacterized protein n=1 Tax=Protea cynaroides TaxID=273540 RepID=A0A9Q0KNE8_9MAGN|nr:hypothetical protein NE237_006910 [Protea cynaroides]